MRITALLFLLLSTLGFGSDLSSIPKQALDKSQLTQPGSAPFHMKATTYEVTNPKNESYKGEIEMWWAAPNRWKRVIRSRSFTSTRIVNGDIVSEEVTGNYEPIWLQAFVDALFDQGKHLEGVDLSKSNDNPVFGGDQVCRRFDAHVGIPPVHNRIFFSYCFRNGLISSIGTPGFHADYFDYKKFAGKQVAMRLEQYIEPGETAGAKVVELNALNDDPTLFAIAKPASEFPIATIDESELRGIAPRDQNIQWPTGKGGKPAGTLTILIGVDTEGTVREISGLNSDNPNMTDAAIEQVRTWKFQHSGVGGHPAQVQGLLTFAFDLQGAQSKANP